MAVSEEINTPSLADRIDWSQLIKWTVYSLLLLNWGLYMSEEWQNAQHTLHNGGDLLEWTSAFGTSLDEMAWFGLLFIWELETYALSEHAWTRFIQWLFLGIRGVCYIFLAHTVFAWSVAFVGLEEVEASPGISSLCQLADQGISFTYNLEYTLVNSDNCSTLSHGAEFFMVDDTAVADLAGLKLERILAWVALQDATTWLLIMFSIELAIWLQERNITGGYLMLLSHLGKVFYAVLFCEIVFWSWLGHWLYAWDQLLWIGGFWAIEFNMKEWRDQIKGAEAT